MKECYCNFCGTKFLRKVRSQHYCSYKCSYTSYNESVKRKTSDKKHKDKIRHAGRRETLLKEKGCICSRCGKEGTSFEIVAHHVTGNSEEHDNQILLCRSCHTKVHMNERLESDVVLPCEICGKEFVRKKKKSRTCSANCYKKLYHKEHPEFHKKELEKTRLRMRLRYQERKEEINARRRKLRLLAKAGN